MLAAAASRDPTNANAQLQYATALADADRNTEALEVARVAYDRHGENLDLGLLVGQVRLRLRDDTAAVATYKQVLTRAPDVERLGDCRGKTGRDFRRRG